MDRKIAANCAYWQPMSRLRYASLDMTPHPVERSAAGVKSKQAHRQNPVFRLNINLVSLSRSDYIIVA